VRQAAGLPEQSISTVSYGAEWAPHPNDTPANRARNRTVVLKISMR
jgi:outer membrane protein OmpA-like peptidoglycan-associated protein